MFNCWYVCPRIIHQRVCTLLDTPDENCEHPWYSTHWVRTNDRMIECVFEHFLCGCCCCFSCMCVWVCMSVNVCLKIVFIRKWKWWNHSSDKRREKKTNQHSTTRRHVPHNGLYAFFRLCLVICIIWTSDVLVRGALNWNLVLDITKKYTQLKNSVMQVAFSSSTIVGHHSHTISSNGTFLHLVWNALQKMSVWNKTKKCEDKHEWTSERDEDGRERGRKESEAPKDKITFRANNQTVRCIVTE